MEHRDSGDVVWTDDVERSEREASRENAPNLVVNETTCLR
jgi:hypothetical protein